MRNEFAKKITELAKINKKIVLLVGDIGNKLFDNFKKKFPNRFYNCGVAEANMVGVAAGLSKVGFLPVIYTITPFLTSRCFEQIRLDICYPNLHAIIVGTGAGLSYSGLGPTHHSLEDFTLMNVIPNMNIICPGDSVELSKLLFEATIIKKPFYLRIGKKGEAIINTNNTKIKIGIPNCIMRGNKIAILSVGNMLKTSMDISSFFKKKEVSLYSFHTIKPLNIKFLKNLFYKYEKIIILEEQTLLGGLSVLVKSNFEILNIKKKQLFCFNSPDKFLVGMGSQENAKKNLGLDADSIYKKIIK